MKVLIYIGHHKVGSTALQTFLAQNSLGLLRSKILYPAVDMWSFSHFLAKAMGKGDSRAFLPANLREPHSALAYRMMQESAGRDVPAQFQTVPDVSQMLHALRCQIRELQPETVVLCSEAFANFGEVDPSLIPRLAEVFPDAEIEIYCAFRRPDQYVVAWHGQRLKVSEDLPPLREAGHRNYIDNIHFNFRTVIEAWHQGLPGARLILRNYADILEAGGSPQDFMARTGAEWPEGLLPVGTPNRSLPLAAMEIVRRANHVLARPHAQALVQHLLTVSDKLTLEPDDRIEMFSQVDRTRLLADFHPIHVYLSALAEVPSFFPDINEIAVARPVPELVATAALLEQLDPDDTPAPEIAAFLTGLQAEFRGAQP